jgi:hypothetical protein
LIEGIATVIKEFTGSRVKRDKNILSGDITSLIDCL